MILWWIESRSIKTQSSNFRESQAYPCPSLKTYKIPTKSLQVHVEAALETGTSCPGFCLLLSSVTPAPGTTVSWQRQAYGGDEGHFQGSSGVQ